MSDGDGYNFGKLKEGILALSKAKNDWTVARKEWALTEIWEADEPKTCLCGHHPIREICVIKNRFTEKSAEVGNICVKRFLGLRSDLIFAAIKRIRKEPDKSLNNDSIVFFHEKKLFTDWEYDFLQNTMRKRNLTPSQMKTRRQLNKKVLSAIKKRGFQGERLNAKT